MVVSVEQRRDSAKLSWTHLKLNSYAILLFTASDLASITSPIHNWVLFLLWLHPFIFSGVISPLISSSKTWNVRPMNQGKLEVVKQGMARVNVDILGISELKWIGMGEFNSDDHYTYLLWAGIP